MHQCHEQRRAWSTHTSLTHCSRKVTNYKGLWRIKRNSSRWSNDEFGTRGGSLDVGRGVIVTCGGAVVDIVARLM